MHCLESLPIEFDRTIPLAQDIALIEDAARIAAEHDTARGPERIPALVTSSGLIASRFLDAAARHVARDKPTFCEWGSGIGIVSCLAGRRGWDVTGIEIEPRLIKTATSLAKRHNVDARFHLGSYKPPGLRDGSPTRAEFDAAAGLALFDFDIIYAYFWPAESGMMTDVFARFGRPGSILLRYGGGNHCDAFRKTADA